MRVGIVALLQESNTFIRERTTIERFREDLLLAGEEVRQRMAGTHHEVGGLFDGLARAGVEAAPIFAARALPFGVIAAEDFERLLAILFGELERAGPLDGLLAAAHGATVAESHPDADGHWLAILRERLGPRLPIVATLDLHANLSERMVRVTDALIAYRSNPHLDQKERGLEAAALMVRTLRREIQPAQAAAFPPLAIDIQSQNTSEAPCLPLYELAGRMLARPGVVSNSILLGFPYADVEEMGASAIVITDGDPALARRLADELGDHLWAHRQWFVGELTGIEEALARAAELDAPVGLLDMGDNAGGGSPGDGTHLARALHERLPAGAFAALFDPESARQAAAAGPGKCLRLRAGGKTDAFHGAPIEATFTVLSVHDGRFEEPEPRHGGLSIMDQGLTAVVRTAAGLTLLLTSRRMPPFSLRQLTSSGLEPRSFRFIVLKGVNAPLAAYRDVCRHFIRVNTPGVTTADLKALDFKRRRRPMFPFEADTTWDGAGGAAHA